MTKADLVTKCLERVGEIVSPGDTQRFYSAASALIALNVAYRLFCLLTLSVETIGTLTLSEGVGWYDAQTTFTDWLVPLRIKNATTGAKIRPATLLELDALSPRWQSATYLSGSGPTRYACSGFGLLAFDKIGAVGSGGATATVTYAKCPTALAADGDEPEIAAEYHLSLVDGAVPFMRILEGAQELEKTFPMFDAFMAAAMKESARVRARSIQQRYDRLPFELTAKEAAKLGKAIMAKAAKS